MAEYQRASRRATTLLDVVRRTPHVRVRLAELGRYPMSLMIGGALALTFPDWGTQRSSWRDSDATVIGDTELAARFLDAVNVI